MGNRDETRDGSAKSIFLDALEIAPAGDRVAYLDRRCGADPVLRAEVEALLLHHDRLEGYLEHPALAPEPTRDGAGRPPAEGPGTVIGPYKLLEQIGEGGMGQVYMAEQTQPIRRRIALKIIKQGMDTHQVVARFEAERQALALMDHPNIAKVLDAGSADSGRPYFIMELVRGVPITEYCDQARLPIPQRLGLFVQVCQAVQHAHQKGVIHRDLKPSNILVTLHDGVPVPKVIDFGIAKATGQQLTEKTLFTGFAQLVGTPLYMSPEQAEMSGLDVDTRSDIYSLGVLLYELLTGSTPFDRETIRKAAFDEMRRIIREDEPPTPSTRLGTLGQTLTTVSARRGSDPRHLGRAVRGELDWVVMKALEKDRTRRYETASGFAADVMRYLTDRPVEAGPPSARYRFRKFARRNRAASTTAAVVGFALIAGTAVSTWQAIRASRAEQQAAARYALARRAVDEMYTQVAEKWLVEQPQLTRIESEFMEKALKFYKEFGVDAGADPDVRHEAAMVHLRMGRIREALGQKAEAVAAYRQSEGILEQLAAAFPTNSGYRDGLARANIGMGFTLMNASRPKEAEQAYRRALDLHERLVADAPHDLSRRRGLAEASIQIGWLFSVTGRPGEAERALRRALVICEEQAVAPPDGFDNRQRLALTLQSLAEVLWKARRYPQAEPLQRRALAIYEELVAATPTRYLRQQSGDGLMQLGLLLQSTDRDKEAERCFLRAVALFDRQASDFPELARYRARLGDAYLSLGIIQGKGAAGNKGRLPEAEVAYLKALGLYEGLTAKRPDAPEYGVRLARVHHDLGHFLIGSDRPREAEEAHHRAEEIIERLVNTPGVDSLTVRVEQEGIQNCLGRLMQRLGRPQEAEAAFRRSLTLQERLSEDFPDRLEYREKLARDAFALAVFLRQTGHPEGAAPLFRRAGDVTARLAAASPGDLDQRGGLANCFHALGDVLRETGRQGEAEAAYREAIGIQERLLADLSARTGASTVPGLGSSDIRHHLGGTLNNLALVLIDRGELDEAGRTLEQALVHQRAAIDADPMNQGHRRFLVEHYTALGMVLIRLREYAKAARNAEELARALPASGLAAARAASCLTRCAVMAAEDDERSPEQRREAARSMIERARILALEGDRLSRKDAVALDELARLFADAPDPRLRDPARAVALAKAAVALEPLEADFRTTLGLAHYRTGDWKAAVASLAGPGGIETDGLGKFLLAMAHWQRGEKDEARKWFDRAVAWVEKNEPRDEDSRRFRAEAATLLGRAAATTP